MNRRHALVGLASAAGGLVLAGDAVRAQQAVPPIPGAVKLELGKPLAFGQQSAPVKLDSIDLPIVTVGKGTFRLDDDSRLTAMLHASVAQYAKVDYWISVAVFDVTGNLLGTAAHKEVVEYIRLGKMLTLFREIELDFGVSKAFSDVAFAVVVISEPDMPAPG